MSQFVNYLSIYSKELQHISKIKKLKANIDEPSCKRNKNLNIISNINNVHVT